MAHIWTRATGGSIPDGARSSGREADGQPLFVARAVTPDGGLHPGKIRPGFGAALIPFGGEEIAIGDYEVLMNPSFWVPTSKGLVPVGAVVSGHEVNGQPLFVARGNLESGVHPGKVRLEFGAANIGFGGKERKVQDYEVLMAD